MSTFALQEDQDEQRTFELKSELIFAQDFLYVLEKHIDSLVEQLTEAQTLSEEFYTAFNQACSDRTGAIVTFQHMTDENKQMFLQSRRLADQLKSVQNRISDANVRFSIQYQHSSQSRADYINILVKEARQSAQKQLQQQ